MQSKHAGVVRRTLEENGPLTWAELKTTTKLDNDAKIKRGLDALGEQLVHTLKRIPTRIDAEVAGEAPAYEWVLAYDLADPDYLLREVQREQVPLHGLTSTIYMPEGMRRWIGKGIPPDWDRIELGRRRRRALGAPQGLAKVADFLHKAEWAFEDYLQSTAEERVVTALPKGEQELYREYLIGARYLEFLDLRDSSAPRSPKRSSASDDAQILRSLSDCLREGLDEYANLPAGNEAKQIHDAVLASPGADLTRKIKAFITSVPAFVEREADRVRAFGFYYEGWAGHPHSMLEVPLATWERSELRRLTKGMHVWDRVQAEKWAMLSEVGERDAVFVKYSRRLEQIRFRESLRQAIQKLFGDFGKDGSRSEKIIREFLKAMDSRYGALTALKVPGDGRFPEPPGVKVLEFLELPRDGTPVDQFCEAVGLEHNPLDLEESAENEAFVVARVYAKRDQLRPSDRALVTNILTILGGPKSRLPGLIKEGFKRGEPGHQKDQIVEACVKQEGEDPEELKLYLPETEEEVAKALEHYDYARRALNRQVRGLEYSREKHNQK